MYNDNLEERYALAMARIMDICSQHRDGMLGFSGNFGDYFGRVASFIVSMKELYDKIAEGGAFDKDLEALKKDNDSLYEDIIGDNYCRSYANPAYAVQMLGKDYGQVFSFLYVELRQMIIYAYEQRKFDMTILCELFLEIFCMFEGQEVPAYESIREAVYWYVSDYSDVLMAERVEAQLVPQGLVLDTVVNADLEDLRYLYRFGEYISENELETARYLNSLPKETIDKMARTFTEGYRIGFVLGNKDLSRKKYVAIRYCLGFERLVRRQMELFAQMGLETVLYRSACHTVNKSMHHRVGVHGAIPNKQMEYDHRFDNALYLDNDFVERKLGALRSAYETYAKEARLFGGPAVMEVFGELPFEPKNNEYALRLSEKQQKLSVKYSNEAGRIVNEYIPGEERSFTIIAYPVPEIGAAYEDIFAETVKINTLDYEKYKNIQQNIIDALDGAAYVHITGQKGNKTDIRVAVKQLEEPHRQTAFENCLADVNIPLGEVFTSPVLNGTNGVVNVSEVYLNDLKFKNLTVEFKDGMVTDYSCDNFEDREKNRAFIKENVLFNHKSVPLGEFAIGTNTTAYVMANRYDIVYKLPILIVEKMGPHFAVGDTCYSWAEDTKVFNPDGKEIVARDNEVSILRKTDLSKAYFNCHTDITIPYDEIGCIKAVMPDGGQKVIIEKGRFVLPGTLELNEPFEE